MSNWEKLGSLWIIGLLFLLAYDDLNSVSVLCKEIKKIFSSSWNRGKVLWNFGKR